MARKKVEPPVPKVPHPHIGFDAAGRAHILDSSVLVNHLWFLLSHGKTVEWIASRYPRLGPGKIMSALAFAYDNPELMREYRQMETDLPVSVYSRQLPLPFGRVRRRRKKVDG